jgi:hypothetical protein
MHARLDEASSVPQAWRDRLRDLTDRAIAFARVVAARADNESDSRRATSNLYHVASAVALTSEGAKIHAMRGDARRALLGRLVIDHRLQANDPFALMTDGRERAIASWLLGDKAASMADVGALLAA